MFLGSWGLMIGAGMVPGTLPAARLAGAARGFVSGAFFLVGYASVWRALAGRPRARPRDGCVGDMGLTPWRIAGRYLEACNCDAICPCRTIAGVPGGRSTHGICYGALAWRVDEGEADGADLAGSAAVL